LNQSFSSCRNASVNDRIKPVEVDAKLTKKVPAT
jgi:hypothetical protein